MQTRYRSRPEHIEYATLRDGVYNYATSSSSTLGSKQLPRLWTFSDMTDVVTPQFRKKQGEGKVIVNAMSTYSFRQDAVFKTSEVRNLTSKSASRIESLSGWGHLGMKPTLPPEVTSLTSSLSTQAITAAYADVGTPELAGVVSLAEIKDTWALLRSPYNGVRAIMARMEREKAARLRALRKKGVAVDSRPPPPEVVSLLADLWLKYRYGLTPLMYDIEGLIRTIQKPSREPVRLTARGSASGSWSESGQSVISDQWGRTFTRPWERSWEVSCRAGVLYEYTSTVRSDLGLTLGNLPSAALDLARYSFVLNWFVNVSDYVSAMTAYLRGDVKGAWVTTTVTCSLLSTCTESFSPPAGSNLQQTSDSTGASVSELHAWKSRRPVTLRDIGLELRLEMSDKRYADASALLWGLLVGNLRPKRRFNSPIKGM